MVSAPGSAFGSNSSSASSSSSANTSSAFGSVSSSSSGTLRGRVQKDVNDEKKISFHLKEISDRSHPSLRRQSRPISGTSEGIPTFRGAKKETHFSEIDKLPQKPRAGTRQRQQLTESYQNRRGKTLNDRDSDKEAESSDGENSSPEHTPPASAVPILAQTDLPVDIDISSLTVEETEQSEAGGDTTDATSDQRIRKRPPKGSKPKSLGSGIAGYGDKD